MHARAAGRRLEVRGTARSWPRRPRMDWPAASHPWPTFSIVPRNHYMASGARAVFSRQGNPEFPYAILLHNSFVGTSLPVSLPNRVKLVRAALFWLLLRYTRDTFTPPLLRCPSNRATARIGLEGCVWLQKRRSEVDAPSMLRSVRRSGVLPSAAGMNVLRTHNISILAFLSSSKHI